MGAFDRFHTWTSERGFNYSLEAQTVSGIFRVMIEDPATPEQSYWVVFRKLEDLDQVRPDLKQTSGASAPSEGDEK